MSVSHRVIHHGLYFAVLRPLTSVLLLVLYIFFTRGPLIPLVIVQVPPLLLLTLITTGVILATLAGVVVACLPKETGLRKRYHRLVGGIDRVATIGTYRVAIVHIKDIVSLALSEDILSGENLVVRIIPALLTGVVMSRIIAHPPGLDISYPEADSLS